MRYTVQGYGDLASPQYDGGLKSGIHNPIGFETLDDALLWLKAWASEKDTDPKEGGSRYSKIDLEDDRILIREFLDSGHSKVVWHFSGWHWNNDEFGLPQGTFPGDTKSVYAILSEEY